YTHPAPWTHFVDFHDPNSMEIRPLLSTENPLGSRIGFGPRPHPASRSFHTPPARPRNSSGSLPLASYSPTSFDYYASCDDDGARTLAFSSANSSPITGDWSR